MKMGTLANPPAAPKQSERSGIAALTAVAITSALCASCASLAQENTRKLCAPGMDLAAAHSAMNNRFINQCILRHNATILRAEQDFSDYSKRFNQLVSSPAHRQDYAALRSKIEKSYPAKAREQALKKLGSLNQWLAKQEGLDLHRWHEYSPSIQRVIAEHR